MNFRDKPELQERLAAEYALGTLRGAARRRLQRWMRGDAALALVVARWEARLAPGQPGRDRHDAVGVRRGPPPGGERADPRGAGRLRRARAAGARHDESEGLSRARPAAVGQRAGTAGIRDGSLHGLSIRGAAGRQSNELWIKTLDPSIQVSGKSLQLWGLPKDGAPRSLGLVEAVEKAALKLPAGADQALADIPTLAVSLEPRGGSPSGAPTGPVLFSGPCLKYW